MKKIYPILLILTTLISCNQQPKYQLVATGFEKKIDTANWWKDNNRVTIKQVGTDSPFFNPASRKALQITWDSIPANRPYTWFTDIKLDTLLSLVNPDVWKNLSEHLWLSFWCNSGMGDTLWLQFMVMSPDHQAKWGSKKMVPVYAQRWTKVAVELNKLEYENWGNGQPAPDFASCSPYIIEVGLRNGSTLQQGFIAAQFDEFLISNYQ